MTIDTRVADLSDALVAAGIPIVTVRRTGNVATVVYGAAATPAQKTQGDNVASGWDWSATAQQAADDAREPDGAAIRTNAANAIAANSAYIALVSPTTAQQTAQIKALTQQNNQVIKAILRLL